MELPPLTVRQIYYALTVRGVIPKTENGYRSTCYQLKFMREMKLIPFGWIADNTRYQLKPLSDPCLDAALERLQSQYRRNPWANQNEHVEIWVEKDALAGVIRPVTESLDVALFVARGYSSLSFIHVAAEQIKAIGKPAFIYHFGDYDPSGVDAAEKIHLGLAEHGADVTFERVAITPEQIESYYLPTRETKRSDPRSRTWGARPSVELDALPAPILRHMVSVCIKKHISQEDLGFTRVLELRERRMLATFRENLVQEQNSLGKDHSDD